MKKLVIFLLLIFVFLAGCAERAATGTGVIIKSISVSPDTAEPGTPILLQTFIQNNGGLMATNVRAELLGLTNEWDELGIPQGRVYPVGELYPSDPSRGITAGEEREVSWDLIGPAKTVDMKYDATVKVSYYYRTTMEAQIRAVTSEYYRQTGETGGVESQTVSAGPLSIEVVAPTTIIAGGRVPIHFKIQNTGPGKVKGDTLTLTVRPDPTVTCSRYTVRLVSGGTSATLSCTINTGVITDYRIFPVSVETSYEYWVKSTTSITVLKSYEKIMAPPTPGVPTPPPVGARPTYGRVHPSVSVTPIPPAPYAEKAGSTLSYTVKVTNKDHPDYWGDSTFSLTYAPEYPCPSGWTCSLSPDSLTISPGSSKTATLSLKSPTTATDSNTIVVKATNKAAPDYMGTASATYIIGAASTDTNPPIIGISSVGDDGVYPYETNDSTPDIAFITDEAAYCRISLISQSYDDMGSSKDCATGQGTKSHICTAPNVGSLGDKTVYIACADLNKNKKTVEVEFELIVGDKKPEVVSVSVPSYSCEDTLTPVTVKGTDDVDVSTLKIENYGDDTSDEYNCVGTQTTCEHIFYHTYTSAGTYTIKAYVVDSIGQKSDTKTKAVSVSTSTAPECVL